MTPPLQAKLDWTRLDWAHAECLGLCVWSDAKWVGRIRGGVGALLEFRRSERKVGAPVDNGDCSSSSSRDLAETLVQVGSSAPWAICRWDGEREGSTGSVAAFMPRVTGCHPGSITKRQSPVGV